MISIRFSLIRLLLTILVGSCYNNVFIILYLLFPQEHFNYLSWSIDIYNSRYSSVSLHFTNWSSSYSFFKFLSKLQSKPSLGIRVENNGLSLFYFSFHLFIFLIYCWLKAKKTKTWWGRDGIVKELPIHVYYAYCHKLHSACISTISRPIFTN